MINMIFNRELLSGNNLGKRKDHAHHVFSISTSRHLKHQPIAFTSEDGDGVSYPYDDPMVLVADIDRSTVKKILVESESSCNVLT